MGSNQNKKLRTIIVLVLLIIILSIPVAFVYALNNGNPYDEYMVNKYIPAHLEKMGYTDEDIIKQSFTQPKLEINNSVYQGHYLVVFQDEPHLTYLYGVTKNDKKVVQFCEKEISKGEDMITDKTEHSESHCIGYLENRG